MFKKKYFIENYKYTEEEKKLITDRYNLIYYIWSRLPDSKMKYSYRNDLISLGAKSLCIAVKTYDSNRGDLNAWCYSKICRDMKAFIQKLNRLQTKEYPLSIEEIWESENAQHSLSNILIDRKTYIEDDCLDRELVNEVISAIRAVCNERELDIINRYCSDSTLSWSAISKQLGISRSRLNQLLTVIRKKVKQRLDTGL